MCDTKLPIIVVCTEGDKSSLEIINNIRKQNADVNTVNLCENIIGYKFHNVTKYYENDIVFIAHENKHINLVPIELLEQVEGCIIYFDSNNKDFLNKLPIYANFIESNNIEFGILLCNELYDNTLDGITYKEAKTFSNTLDVIELDRLQDNDDDERNGTSHHDPVGYDELLQAIRAIIWSNVDLKRKSIGRNTVSTDSTLSDTNDTKEAESNELNRRVSSNDGDNDGDDGNIETELAGFEQLLTEVMMFKDTTSTWSRSERLAYAEKFAFAFDNLLQNNGPEKKSTATKIDNQDSSSDSD